MIKKLLFSCIMIFSALGIIPAMAGESVINALFISTEQQNDYVFLFEDKPVVSFNGNNLVVNSITASVTLDKSDISKLTLGNQSSTAIASHSMSEVTFHFNGNSINVSGLESGTIVRVFSLDGKLLRSVLADEQGSASLSLKNINKETVIVKTKYLSYKFLKL